MVADFEDMNVSIFENFSDLEFRFFSDIAREEGSETHGFEQEHDRSLVPVADLMFDFFGSRVQN